MSLREDRLGIRGLMRSSTVTAAMALMLVDAVLGGMRRGGGMVRPHPETGHTPAGAHLLGEAPSCPHYLTCQDPTQPKGRGMDDRLPQEWRRCPPLTPTPQT